MPGSTTARGLGWEHQQRRKALLPYAIGKPCPLCGELMLKGQPLDLDHSVPRSLGGTVGDRITHRFCNRSRGNGTRPRRTPVIAPPQTSRDW